MSTPQVAIAQTAPPAASVVESVEAPAPVAEENTPAEAPAVTPAEVASPVTEPTPVTPVTPVTEEVTTEEEALTEIPTETPVVTPVSEVTSIQTEEGERSPEKTEEVAPAMVCATENTPKSTSQESDWQYVDGKWQTKDPVELGVTYAVPGEEGVEVTFRCVPGKESDRKILSVEPFSASSLQLPQGVRAASTTAYDITTDMSRGTFEYSLQLPKQASGRFGVSYIEKSVQVATTEPLKKKDVQAVAKQDTKNTDEAVTAEKLDHFTIFVVTSGGTSTQFEITPDECTTDSAGANDQPGQKDLTQYCEDAQAPAGTLNITWSWDETSFSGANTGDSCSLYDTDGDGMANYALCVGIGGSPATLQYTKLYGCTDGAPDRCTGGTEMSPFTSACSIGTLNTDPFTAGSQSPRDTVAACSINISDIPGATIGSLMDVCSFPSGEPGSAPSDCVILRPSSAKVEIKKTLSPATDAGKFNLLLDGVALATAVGDGGTTGEQVVSVTSGTTHTFAETAAPGTNLSDYVATVSCRDANGTGVAVPVTGTGPWTFAPVNQSDVVCTITNTRINNASLTIIKKANPQDGQDFSFVTTGAGLSNFSLDDDADATLSNTKTFTSLAAGTYSVTEDALPAGWQQMSATCSNGSTPDVITLATGEAVTCTFENVKQAQLILQKTVVNDNGGTKVAADFPAFVNGSAVTWGTANTVAAGTYVASETTLPGYAPSAWGGDCAADGSVTLAAGETKTCTITNDDVAPKLILQKTVINNNGGTKVAADFPAFIGTTPATWGAENMLAAGTYVASETTLPGYAPSAWGGDCAADGSVTLAVGETKTCTITNDDIAPTLTLVKTVVNDNGGTKVAADFPVFLNGSATTWGTANTVAAGTYTASETTDTGYAASTWGGDCAADGSVTLAPGENKTCTITNDDIAPKLILQKTVVNDNGGTKIAADFAAFVGTTAVTWGAENTLAAGTYVASEITDAGYAASVWGGDCAADGSVTLAVGEVKTCTITNDDIAPTLTLMKIVVNDNGGTKVATDFSALINGSGVAWGTPNTLAAGTYTASEATLTDYTPSIWGGDCAADGSVTLLPGENKVCTITNDDIAPTLTLVKTVVNDNGGTKVVADFPLFIGTTQVTSGTATEVKAGELLTVSETTDDTYTASAWGGDCAADGTIMLAPGENKTCTLTNDDMPGTLVVDKVTIPSVPEASFGVTATGTSAVTNPDQLITSATPVTYTVHAGTYSVMEIPTVGWDQTANTCNDVAVASGETKNCTITNTQRATIVVTLAEDVNADSRFDAGDAPLAAWQTSNGVTNQSTDVGGVTTYGNLVPGSYSASGEDRADWIKQATYCVRDGADIDATNITLLPGETLYCYVVYTLPDPSLVITKTNDSYPTAETPGNQVQYTLKVRASEARVKNVMLTDVPPAGFVYIPGSVRITSSIGAAHAGPLDLSHVYASPGEYTLGDMVPDEEITITYDVNIASTQDSGTYKDLAYADGVSVRGNEVIANDIAEADKNDFVGTQVIVDLPVGVATVALDKDTKTETHTKKQYVLGASTLLPSTGASTLWLVVALLLILGGIGALWASRSSRGKKTIATSVIVLLCFVGAANGAEASSPLAASIEAPKTVMSGPFQVGFVALDKLQRPVTVKCLSNGAVFDSYTLIPGGSSGDCQVTAAVIPTSGTYSFSIEATAGTDTLTTATQDVTVVLGTPGTPTNYVRDDSACRDKITFTTADDGGKTVAVELYRGTERNFEASTPVATLTIGSNAAGEIVSVPPSCTTEYFYAVRAVSTAGVGSSFVGDTEVVVRTKNRTVTVTNDTAAPVQGALVANNGDQATATTEQNAATTVDTTTNEAAPQVLGAATEVPGDSLWQAIKHLVTASWKHEVVAGLIAAVILWLLWRLVRREKREE